MGAVQVFGENEHATFRVEENKLITLSRENFKFGDIVGVGHNLIHQMGNLTDKPICSLHVYGVDENLENVTGDAYLYDVSNSSIQVINGGVFFDLPNSDIEDIIEGPIGDFPTQLRDLVEKGRRIRCSNPNSNKIEVIESKILSENFKNMLSNFLNGTNKHGLDLLKKEMEEANKFLSESKVEGRASLFATLYSF